ncbi:Serine transporter [Lactiplantibacillus plantarum]|nr:Serine transporter [Lactiplantibacillus plantarum]KZU13384.1 Serine transporter [Lactiplantibacillus plantarum]
MNFVPVSKVAKLAKAAKVLATAKKAEQLNWRRSERPRN